MKNVLTTIVIVVALFAGAGCLEMVTPPVAVETKTAMVELTKSVDAYQDIVATAINQMEEDKLISGETVVKIGELQKKVDELQPVVTKAVVDVIEAEYSGNKMMDFITAVQAANTATAPVNPYAPIIDIVTKTLLGIFGVGAAGFAVKKSGEAKTWRDSAREAFEEKEEIDIKAEEYAGKYQAMKQGTEQFKLNNPDKAGELYAAIGRARNGR